MRELSAALAERGVAEVAVASVRDSMGDRSLVRTVPRRGYRLEVGP